jgi:hypothetical protein
MFIYTIFQGHPWLERAEREGSSNSNDEKEGHYSSHLLSLKWIFLVSTGFVRTRGTWWWLFRTSMLGWNDLKIRFFGIKKTLPWFSGHHWMARAWRPSHMPGLFLVMAQVHWAMWEPELFFGPFYLRLNINFF